MNKQTNEQRPVVLSL